MRWWKRWTGLAVIAAGLGGCSEPKPDDELCDGRDPKDGEDVAATLYRLEFGTFNVNFNDSGSTSGPESIITDQDSWDALVAAMGTDAGLSPDWATEAVFQYDWTYGGCDEDMSYYAWRFDDAIRVRAWEKPVKWGCDAAFDTRDLVLVSTGGLTDLGWCE